MPLTGKKILVTEDEPDQQTFIVTILKDAGLEVVVAHNGGQALEAIENENPDLMTLDINMPGTDVLQVLASVTGSESAPRICIVSGRPELRRLILDRFEGVPMGYVDKPFTEEALVEELTRIAGD
jgi:CheY-like chemotaxis protein